MSKQSNHGKVFTARSLEETKRILNSADRFGFKFFVYKILVRGWVSVANQALLLLKYIVFKRVSDSTEGFRNIVVYTHGLLGDHVVILPALAALKNRYQSARISVIANLGPYPEAPSKLLRALKCVDHLLVLDDHPVRRRGLHLILDPRVEGVTCDLFVNLAPYGNRGWFKAVVREMIFAKWIGAKYAVGFHIATRRFRRIFDRIQHHFVENEPLRSGRVLKELGLRPVENANLLPENPYARNAVLQKIRAKKKDADSFFVVSPGGNLRVKHWPAEKFGLLVDWINMRYGASVIIGGADREREIAEDVVKASGGLAASMVGETDVHELIELLRMAKCCVTNDNGIMHISAMIGIPTVAIFSMRIPPTWWFPNSDKIASIFSITECRYCYDDYCESKHCLSNIEVDHIAGAIEQLLEAN